MRSWADITVPTNPQSPDPAIFLEDISKLNFEIHDLAYRNRLLVLGDDYGRQYMRRFPVSQLDFTKHYTEEARTRKLKRRVKIVGPKHEVSLSKCRFEHFPSR